MLNVISVDEAVTLIKNNFTQSTAAQTVPLPCACGRIAACDITSRENVPPFSRSTMDGYALFAGDTYGAGEAIPSMLDIDGEILMGEEAKNALCRGKCIKISTGGMLPAGADAVIPVENTDEENGVCLIYKSVSPFENVTREGDDIKRGAVITEKGTLLTPAHIGLLASAGVFDVPVIKKPLIGIISTGNEIIAADEDLTPGKIREVNSFALAALCASLGCETEFFGTVKDEYGSILAAVSDALGKCDAVLISGGSSAGVKDMTVSVIAEKGEVLAHGLAMKPGKPTIIGKCGNKAVFGLPGHPAACFFVTEIIVKQYIDLLLGKREKAFTKECTVTENISSNHGREEFICVKTDGGYASPVYGKSGLMSIICEADGYIRIGRNTEGVKKGERVSVHRFSR